MKPSTQAHHEYTACVRVFSGTLTLAQLTAELGEPTDGHDRGEPVSRRRPQGPKRTSALWRLESRLDRARALDEHIAELLDYVEALPSGLDSIRHECELDICCGIFSGDDAQGGFGLEPSLSRRLADLHLPVVFDIY